MSDTNIKTEHENVLVVNAAGASSVVLVCEHASHYIPPSFEGLGLAPQDRKSHAAWDPGALAVAEHLSKWLDAPLVAGAVSRLVYDCNRPPSAPDAMPARSEIVEVPGNANLTQSQRDARTQTVYEPFRAALAGVLQQVSNPVVVTVHSFTPIYHGRLRRVEIGILHDSDTRLADAMLAVAAQHTDRAVLRNEPYGPENGVTHTLQEHALGSGHLNVMLEVRNDLIATEDQQKDIGAMLSTWIADACGRLNGSGGIACRA